jgi:hypothetical protein
MSSCIGTRTGILRSNCVWPQKRWSTCQRSDQARSRLSNSTAPRMPPPNLKETRPQGPLSKRPQTLTSFPVGCDSKELFGFSHIRCQPHNALISIRSGTHKVNFDDIRDEVDGDSIFGGRGGISNTPFPVGVERGLSRQRSPSPVTTGPTGGVWTGNH